MAVNRVLSFIDSDHREENRFHQALRWYEEANAVSEHLDSLTEGLLSFWVPSVSNLFEKVDPFEVRVYFHAEEPLEEGVKTHDQREQIERPRGTVGTRFAVAGAAS